MNNTTVDKLKFLGLTKQEVAVYKVLSENNNDLTAQEIAFKVRILPNAVYRTCRNLRELGFVKNVQAYPLSFRAIETLTAAPLLAKRKIKQLQDFTKQMGNLPLLAGQETGSIDINLIYEAENIYEEAAKLLDAAKREMLVISIGEPIPPNLLLSVKNARDRGVAIKMIVHKYDEGNKMILENLKKNGYIIRHFPGWGFHIAIYDEAKSLLIVNNPENTDERAAMLINSTGLSKALCDYFYATWQKAKRV